MLAVTVVSDDHSVTLHLRELKPGLHTRTDAHVIRHMQHQCARCLRRTPVSSVEPSLTTSTSACGICWRTLVTTRPMLASSFSAGMMMRVLGKFVIQQLAFSEDRAHSVPTLSMRRLCLAGGRVSILS